ncbi:hypothetical protein FKV24_004950 [Lysobacter maris]|uniref:Uncharacterized protein n=1 Tax=Marilutibacter maris TaxID=1605891 RepID=A0A508B313_9GAMM|nr:hypothetical protein [Lysobacter maris]KAB8195620.1 hypothetical protein FKV24_004950 [Lysobacter maris]
MKTVKYSMMFIAALVLAKIGHSLVGAYLPCTYFPRGYWQALSIDHKFQNFQSRHGRLPDMLDSQDVRLLGLDKGYPMRFEREQDTYVMHLSPDRPGDIEYAVEPTDGSDATRIQYMSFDGPWVEYRSRDRSIQCGIR